VLGDAISGAGKQWKSLGARMVSACFKIGKTSYLSCHAMPLYGVHVKDKFWDGLESFLDSVNSGLC